MKKLKVVLTVILLFMFVIAQAQKVQYNGKIYLVKGNAIFVDKVDVTNTLSIEDQNRIKNKLSEQILADKKLKENEKAEKKAEKRIKAAEKKQKKAEKQLKANEKAKKNYADV